MKSLEIMKKRQSIREFTNEAVSEEHLKLILEAAYNAPIGRAAYDRYELIIINDLAKLNELATTIIKIGKRSKHPFFKSPLVIFIAGQKTKERLNGADAGCIIQNIMLVASELGLGSCYLYSISELINEHEKLKKYFVLQEGHQIMSAVTIGHPLNKNLDLKARPGIKTKYL